MTVGGYLGNTNNNNNNNKIIQVFLGRLQSFESTIHESPPFNEL